VTKIISGQISNSNKVAITPKAKNSDTFISKVNFLKFKTAKLPYSRYLVFTFYTIIFFNKSIRLSQVKEFIELRGELNCLV
jgi:hypothetical protein